MTDDIQSITTLIYTYAELLDTGDFDALGRLFERAIVQVHGSGHQARGAEAARRMLTTNSLHRRSAAGRGRYSMLAP